MATRPKVIANLVASAVVIAAFASCSGHAAPHPLAANVGRQQVTVYADPAATTDANLQRGLDAIEGNPAEDRRVGLTDASIDDANHALVIDFGPGSDPRRIGRVVATVRPLLHVVCVLVMTGVTSERMGDAGSRADRIAHGEVCRG